MLLQLRPSFSVVTAVAALTLLIAPTASARSEAEKWSLSPQFEPGETIRYEYELRTNQTMSAFGSDQDTTSTMTTELEREVLEGQVDGLHRVGITFRRMNIQFEGGQVPGGFDSADPATADPGNIYAQICRPMIDRQIELRVDDAGSIKAVENLADMAPEGLAGILFEQLFSADALRAMLQPLFQIRDAGGDQTVGVGETWELERPAVASLGVPRSSLSLRLANIEPGRIGVIQVEGKPEATMPVEAAVLPNIEIKDAELTGTARWNAGRGVLESLNTEAITEMVSSAQGITISVKMTSTTKLKRVTR